MIFGLSDGELTGYLAIAGALGAVIKWIWDQQKKPKEQRDSVKENSKAVPPVTLTNNIYPPKNLLATPKTGSEKVAIAAAGFAVGSGLFNQAKNTPPPISNSGDLSGNIQHAIDSGSYIPPIHVDTFTDVAIHPIVDTLDGLMGTASTLADKHDV